MDTGKDWIINKGYMTFYEYPKYVALEGGGYKIFDSATEEAQFFGTHIPMPVPEKAEVAEVTINGIKENKPDDSLLITKEDYHKRLEALQIPYDKRWNVNKLRDTLEFALKN